MPKCIVLLFLTHFIVAEVICQRYLDLRSEYPSTTNDSYITSLSNLTKYEEDDILAVFDSIKNSMLQFGYPQGGCQNRAHLMSMILGKKLNIKHSKIWLFSPSNLDRTDTRKLEINDKNLVAPDDVIKWNYHVAPCVLISKNNKIDTLIIDPSLDNQKPLRISEWLKLIRNSDISRFTFLNSDWYFFYTDNGGKVITGEFYKFEVDSRFCSDNYRNLTLEKSLAINDLAVYIINKYLNLLRNSSNQNEKNRFASLRKIFGNVDALTKMFGSMESYCGPTVADNISLKQTFQEHHELMADANLYYIERLVYWTSEIQKIK